MEKREKLGAEIRFLGRVLGDVIKEQAGMPLFDLEEEIRLGARARREGSEGAERALDARIRSMSGDEARAVVRSFTLFFDLMNLAEDRERVRVLRERERARYPEPRPESMEEAVLMMRGAGLDAAGIRALLELLSIGLVFTAHPTEAKRRSVRTKVRLLRQSLVQLDDTDLLPRERERIVTGIRSIVTGLWQTDLVRPRRPSVLEEVEVGLYFAATLWDVAPTIYAELDRALRKIYPEAAGMRLPPFLSFGSWIGGDRDGNPFVSARVTALTFVRMRAAAVEAHLSRCRLLFDELTSSDLQAAVSPRAEIRRWRSGRGSTPRSPPSWSPCLPTKRIDDSSRRWNGAWNARVPGIPWSTCPTGATARAPSSPRTCSSSGKACGGTGAGPSWRATCWAGCGRRRSSACTSPGWTSARSPRATRSW